MLDSERIKTAYKYAEEKHKNQYRIGSEPYFTHPEAVANILKEKGYGTDYIITALFHDLLEDTDASEKMIENIGGKDVLEAVKILTKKEGYIMSDYVSAIRNNPIAFAVKGADRLHNLRSAFVTSTDFRKKYIKETIDWYMDFCPEIPAAVKALSDTIE
ncbi:MAG: HD domain-containing protein [Oscillospiraceae bacterium]|nr:HD domain-containing protein [Oscillospiraceae bacterium]